LSSLQIPLNPEQQLVAEAVERLGAGRMMSKEASGREIEAELGGLLSDRSYADAAESFARRHRDFDPARQRKEMLARAMELLE